MHTQDARLLQHRLVNTHVCEECLRQGRIQKLVIRYDKVVCPVSGEHTHHIRETSAMMRLRQEQLITREVLQNYPELDPTPATAERLRAGIAYCEKLRRVQVETDQEANRAGLAVRLANGEDVPFSLFL